MRKRLIFFLLVILAACGIFSVATCTSDKKTDNDLYHQVELFADSVSLIKNNYVDEVDPKKLIYGALKGMLTALDPYSQFLPPQEYTELRSETEGKFGGLGIELTVRDGFPTVISPVEDTPAWKAGIKAEDRIVKINNEITRDMSLPDAVKLMRGKPGEAVNISVLRESEKRIIEFRIIRDVIKLRDIKDARILQEQIGYIRIIEFRENTFHNLQETIEKLQKEGMSALIIDLRNNPGGLLDQAIKVAGIFLPKGTLIVYTKSHKEARNLEYKASNPHALIDMPLVILINQGSASGSEIVAGALQDNKRALIIGMKSFGKGSVQTIIPLNDNSALRLTTSKYFTASGKVIHGNGITPDITVEEGKIELSELTKPSLSKAEDVFSQLEQAEKNKKEQTSFDYKSDNQLMRAVDALKIAKLYGRNTIRATK